MVLKKKMKQQNTDITTWGVTNYQLWKECFRVKYYAQTQGGLES